MISRTFNKDKLSPSTKQSQIRSLLKQKWSLNGRRFKAKILPFFAKYEFCFSNNFQYSHANYFYKSNISTMKKYYSLRLRLFFTACYNSKILTPKVTWATAHGLFRQFLCSPLASTLCDRKSFVFSAIYLLCFSLLYRVCFPQQRHGLLMKLSR